MKIVDQKIKIVNISHAKPFDAIEKAARKCFQPENVTSWEYVRKLIERGHLSPLEHVSFSFDFLTDREVLLELTRHRICSFSVQSTRYVARKKYVIFCRPVFWKNGSLKMEIWESSMQVIENLYHSNLRAGMKPEEARTILPNSLAVYGRMTCNYRELLYMFKLKCNKAAHPQIRALFCKLRVDVTNLLDMDECIIRQ